MFNIESFIEHNNVSSIDNLSAERQRFINILKFETPEDFDEFIEGIKPLKLGNDLSTNNYLKNHKHHLRMLRIEGDVIKATKSSDPDYYKDCTIWSYQEFKQQFGVNKINLESLMIK